MRGWGGEGGGKKSDYPKTGLKGPWSLHPIPTSAEMRQFISHPLLYLAAPDFFFLSFALLWEMRGCVIRARKMPKCWDYCPLEMQEGRKQKKRYRRKKCSYDVLFLGAGFDTRQAAVFSPGYCPLDFVASSLNIKYSRSYASGIFYCALCSFSAGERGPCCTFGGTFITTEKALFSLLHASSTLAKTQSIFYEREGGREGINKGTFLWSLRENESSSSLDLAAMPSPLHITPSWHNRFSFSFSFFCNLWMRGSWNVLRCGRCSWSVLSCYANA